MSWKACGVSVSFTQSYSLQELLADLSRVEGLIGHALFYGYELPFSLPPQTLLIVFIGVIHTG